VEQFQCSGCPSGLLCVKIAQTSQTIVCRCFIHDKLSAHQSMSSIAERYARNPHPILVDIVAKFLD
jgi:hypothetical protein